MLLDPLREGAVVRAKSIPDPDISPEIFREQIVRSIDFLKGLKAGQKNVRLKLYPDMPLLKLRCSATIFSFDTIIPACMSALCLNMCSRRSEPGRPTLFISIFHTVERSGRPEYDLDR
jgi:hypothetical protein